MLESTEFGADSFRRQRSSTGEHDRACAVVEGAGPREPVTLARPHHRKRAAGNYGASRSRPLARRADSTLRPPTLFIRERKPWVRLRLMTEGWNVRFMMVGLGLKKPYIRTC